MITQIYNIQTVEEAIGCWNAGADIVGLTPKHPAEYENIPAQVSDEVCTAVMNASAGKGKVAMICLSDDPNFALSVAEKFHPHILHISAERFYSDEEFYHKVKAIDPEIQILQAVPVADAIALEDAIVKAQNADLLILDSVNTLAGCIGAAGTTHDWNIDRAIVESIKIPVICAGGLGPHNVAQIIETVHPWGVDSLTKTNKDRPDGIWEKDLDKVAQFCRIAKSYE